MKLERRRSYPCCQRRRKIARTPAMEAQKTATRPVFVAVDFAGFRPRYHLDLDSQLTLIVFQPTPPSETTILAMNNRRKARDLGSSICRRCHAWVVTTGTIALIEVRTIKHELSVAVDWISVTVDRQWQFNNFANFGDYFVISELGG